MHDWACDKPGCGSVNDATALYCLDCGSRRPRRPSEAHVAPRSTIADPPIPEYPILTPAEEEDRAAAVQALQVTLTRAIHRVESLRPARPVWRGDGEAPPDPEDMAARAAKAQAMLQAFHAHNAKAQP